jgi:hypothetical protein
MTKLRANRKDLTVDDRLMCRQLCDKGYPQADIAAFFKVSQGWVSAVANAELVYNPPSTSFRVA